VSKDRFVFIKKDAKVPVLSVAEPVDQLIGSGSDLPNRLRLHANSIPVYGTGNVQ